eukprot:g18820.t1
MGPSYVCLFIGYVEQSLFCCYTGTIPHLFLHYINDSISITSCSHEELEQFINFTNTFHPNLKFTWTISDTFLSFLDTSVSISGYCLNANVYFKPTDTHSYLDYTSSHSPSCKNAKPYSQFLRVCSQDGVFHSRTSQMSSYFKECNFLHKNKDRVPLVLTYHPTNLRIQHIILCHFCQLQPNSTTKDIFLSPPLSAFRRDHSLCNSLICSTLLTRPTTPGTFPCNHRKCYTCLYTSPLTSIPGPRKPSTLHRCSPAHPLMWSIVSTVPDVAS